MIAKINSTTSYSFVARFFRSGRKRKITPSVSCLLFAPLVLALFQGSAGAQVRVNDFLVRHDFELNAGGTVVPQVKGLYYLHAWVQTASPDCADAEVLPTPQPATWDDYGIEHWADVPAGIKIVNDTSLVEVDLAEFTVPPSGYSQTFTVSAEGSCSPQYAEANSEFAIDPFTAGTPVTGFISSYGKAEADESTASSSRSYAFGMSSIEVQGGRFLRDGTIRWLPTLQDVVADSVSSGFQLDPVSFVVDDLQTSDVVEGTLVSISVDLTVDNATSHFRWKDDLVDIRFGEAGTFEIDMTSPYLANPGYLELEFDGMQVTVANDTGIFDGLLPVVGTFLPLAFALPSEQLLEYDLGDYDGHDLAVRLFLGGNAVVDFPTGNPLVDVPDGNGRARSLDRLACHPNPFNPNTSVEYELAQRGPVTLEVYDQRGRLVRKLVDEVRGAGEHTVIWGGRDRHGLAVASGVYLIVLKTEAGKTSRSVSLVK